MFWSLRGSASTQHAEIDLLAGGADRSYRAPDGSCSMDLGLVSARVQAAEGRCRLLAGYDFAVGRADFSPHVGVPSRETFHALLERSWKRGRRSLVTCSLEIDKHIQWDTAAWSEETTRCLLKAQAALGAFDAAAELRCSTPNSFGATLTAHLRLLPRLRFGLECGLDGLCAGDCAATLLCDARVGAEDRVFTLEAGIKGWQPDLQGQLDHIRIAIAWSMSSREEKTRPVRERRLR